PSAPTPQLQPNEQPAITRVEPGPPQAQTPARQAAREARRGASQQARAKHATSPAAPQPQAVAPTPSPAPPAGVGERTEPVHGPTGGVSIEGTSESEISTTARAHTP